MKKKTLFSLALASILMVGCQQDEFVSMNEDTSVDLGKRPELGQVSLNWGIPTTRMALNTMNNYSFVWEEGDKLGAAIVDQLTDEVLGGTKTIPGSNDFNGEDYSSLEWSYLDYVTGATKEIEVAGKKVKVTAKEAGIDVSQFYKEVDYISSNYPYARDAKGAWTTQANLVEGNYVFYAPYNQAHLTRQPIVVTLPMEQDCTEESKALKDFYKGTDPVAVGIDFLSAPDNRNDVIYPSVKMTNIFAYPQITIKNDFNGYLFKGDDAVDSKYYSSAAAGKYTMKLKKVEIYTTELGAPMDYKRALSTKQFKDEVNENGWDNDEKKFTTGETSKILAATSAYNEENYPAYPATQADAKTDAGYATQYANGSDDLISDYEVKHITCDLGGKELKNGESYKFFAIMPAEDYKSGLFAKVYVEIDGVSYIILTSTDELGIVEDEEAENNGYAYFTDATAALGDYNFSDPKHGSQGVRLVRGQRFPSAEVMEDASAVKDFAGSLMTINLVGGKKQAAYAMATEVQTENKGIVDNADFIDHIAKKIQRGTDLTENTDVQTTSRDKWAAGNIAFAPNNKVVINAELIKALYNTLYDKRPDGSATATGTVLTLNATRLPIASDVVVTLKVAGSTVYTFTTSDNVSYDIDFGLLVGDEGSALVNGINTISADATLKVAKDVTGAVVFVTDGTATLDNATGITGINVAASATLKVDCSTDALIMSKGTIEITEKGALTNANNVLEGTVQNDYLKAIAGNVKDATISAEMVGWPTTTIPATAKVNALSINIGAAGALNINKAEVEKLANLKDVAITLGNNVTSIKSSTSVTLTNIKNMTATATDVKWTTTANRITIYCGVDEPATNFFTNIAAGTGVTFAK